MSMLRCPNCDYDVRASLMWQNTVRCPECGIIVSLDALAALLVRRRRKTRSMWTEFAAAMAVVMILLLVNIIHDAPPGLAHLRDRLMVLAGEPALIVTLLAIALMLGVTCNSWNDVFRWQRLVLFFAAVLVVLLFPAATALFLLLLSLLAFGAFSFREEGERQSPSDGRPLS